MPWFRSILSSNSFGTFASEGLRHRNFSVVKTVLDKCKRLMEISLAVDPWIVQNIHQQLVAKNAVEVRAFSGITSDYQRCLHQLRDLQVINQSGPRLEPL